MSLTGLLGGLVAAMLIALSERTQRRALAGADGWKRLRPGWLQHGLFVACSGFTTMFVFVFLAGGSSRADGGMQNAMAVLLFLGCAAAAAHTGWLAYGRTILWKGNEIRVRPCIGRDVVHRIPDVQSVRQNMALADCTVTFRKGSTLRFSLYAHGARDLLARLPQGAKRA